MIYLITKNNLGKNFKISVPDTLDEKLVSLWDIQESKYLDIDISYIELKRDVRRDTKILIILMRVYEETSIYELNVWHNYIDNTTDSFMLEVISV